MQKKNFFVAGMPGSGKTAYIGGLWIQLTEGIVPTIYKKVPGYMPENLSKIDDIAKCILSCKNLERTKIGDNNNLEVLLNDKNENEVLLKLPDLAGEIFRDLVKDRQMDNEIVSMLAETDCILFFTYYRNMSKEGRIKLSERNLNEDSAINSEQNSLGNIEDSKEANESQVVDLLLALLELLKKDKNKIHIRFIMSAWDMVEKEFGSSMLPENFMKQTFPLLYQCIQNNQDRINFEYWGISALGGDFDDQKDRERLTIEEMNAIKVVEPNGNTTHDLTKVLAGIGD